MSKLVIGLSGGIGSGKTSVSDLFAEYGIDIIDADVIAREVVEPGTWALAKIVEKFGSSILDEKGQLDRVKLREHIFADPSMKDWLNALLHPIIREQMQIQTDAAQSGYCILSVPLLVENKLNTQVDRVLIVDVSEQSQVSRTLQRDKVSEQQVRAIMASQATREQRLSLADDVIDNDGDIDSLSLQVSGLHRKYSELVELP
jgi:dephospho-CoA kinase